MFSKIENLNQTFDNPTLESTNMKLNTRIVALALMLGAGPAFAASTSLAVSDFNGDGIVDTAVRVVDFKRNLETLTVSFGNGKGGWAAGPVHRLVDSIDIAAGDLNGDGIGDLAIQYREGIATYLGNASGDFVPGTQLATTNPGGIQLGDLNRDGLLDVITYSTPLYNPASASVFFGTGNGGFSQEVKVVDAIGEASSFDSMVAGDLTGDGNLDLVFYSAFGRLAFAVGDGKGKFAVGSTQTFGDGTKWQGMSVAIGDYTADRLPDLIVQSEGRGVVVLAGDGSGSFKPSAALPLATENDGSVNPIAVGDFNLDGLLNVIEVDSATGEIHVFRRDEVSQGR